MYYSSFDPGVPAAAEIADLPAKTKNDNVTLKWKEAENNRAPITQYTVYRRTVRKDGTSLSWIKIKELQIRQIAKLLLTLKKAKNMNW